MKDKQRRPYVWAIFDVTSSYEGDAFLGVVGSANEAEQAIKRVVARLHPRHRWKRERLEWPQGSGVTLAYEVPRGGVCVEARRVCLGEVS